nr:MAG TPA: hypothetical protein [Caudoviricetes sp.]
MKNTTIADCNISYLQRYPDYQRLFPFYRIISFQAWKRSGGIIKRLYGRNDHKEKNAQKRTKYHGNVEFFPITRYLLL